MSKVYAVSELPIFADDLMVVAADAFIRVGEREYPAEVNIVAKGDERAVTAVVADPFYCVSNAGYLTARVIESELDGLWVIHGLELRPANGAEPTCWRDNVKGKHLDGVRRKWWISAVLPPRNRALPISAENRPRGSGNALELSIIGEIGEGRYRAREIAAHLREAEDSTIVVTLDSPGGDAQESLDIHRALVGHPCRVEIDIVGRADSGAFVIAMAGDHRRIIPGGKMMAHQVHIKADPGSRADDLRDLAEHMERLNRNIATVIHAASGCGLATARAWIDQEKTFGAGEAIAAGIVHELIDDIPASVPTQPKARFAAIRAPFGSVRPASALAPLYGAAQRYKAGQTVRHDGKVYAAVRNTFYAPGLEPGRGPDWQAIDG